MRASGGVCRRGGVEVVLLTFFWDDTKGVVLRAADDLERGSHKAGGLPEALCPSCRLRAACPTTRPQSPSVTAVMGTLRLSRLEVHASTMQISTSGGSPALRPFPRLGAFPTLYRPLSLAAAASASPTVWVSPFPSPPSSATLFPSPPCRVTMAPRQGAAGTSVARAVEEPPASAPLLGFLPAPAVGFRPPVLTARSSLVGRPPLRGVRVAPVSPVGGRSAAAAATAAAAAAVPRMFLKVCRQCKQQYDPEANEPGSCRYVVADGAGLVMAMDGGRGVERCVGCTSGLRRVRVCGFDGG